ncbi:hypothetical protein LB504_000648 [Fusarium proliferatum]|nr:hypothetical protein LB504_000648 [Fusarium proliferatum]
MEAPTRRDGNLAWTWNIDKERAGVEAGTGTGTGAMRCVPNTHRESHPRPHLMLGDGINQVDTIKAFV